jgi:drug/metabolite transporter (DMT)-like permease
MTWFFIAIFAPLLWSFTNHIDKYILSRYSSDEGGVGGLIVYSALFPLLILPFMVIIHPLVLDVIIRDVLVLLLAGAINVIAVILYLYAISDDETSTVIPFFQLVPVFGFFLGFLVLGEVLTKNQIFAAILIITGTVILSLEFKAESSTKFKKKLLLLMIGSSLLYACYDTLFKVIAIKGNFWTAMFWEQLGMVLMGGLLIVFVRKYRLDFYRIVRGHTTKFFSLNVLNEFVYALGSFIYNYSLLLAPIVLVMLVNSYQPVFVFIEGIIITLLLPKIATEKLTREHLVQKIVSITVIVIGSALLYI